MHFLREHFNSKHKKLNINYFASKAKTCPCLGKNWFYEKPISINNIQFLAYIFPLGKYFCKHMHQECPV